MVYVAESSRGASRQHQISNVGGEKIRLPKVINGSQKFEEMPNRAMDKNMIRPKPSECYQKYQMGNRDEELVKHMSNLPKYLQKAEVEKSVQSKALNFGVIDWNHLEKWKYSDRMPAKPYGSSSPQRKHIRLPLSHEQQLSGPLKHPKRMPMPGQEFLSGPINPKPVTSRRSSSESNIDKVMKVSVDKTKPVKDDLFPEQFKNDRRNDQDGRNKVNPAPEPQNIVILIPKAKHSPKRNFSETSQIAESITISQGDSSELDKTHKRSSSQEFSSREQCPISPSCQYGQNRHKSNTHDVNSDLVTNHHRGETQAKTLRDKQTSMESIKSADKVRCPSPTRQFSLNLGMMSRSLSFKETSPTVPRMHDSYAIPKSGPVTYGVEKSKAGGKGRSSPLRRLLDPLLLRPSKGITHVEKMEPNPTNTNKHPSSHGALLQLSIKDGLPFLKFVVDGSNDILVTAVKQLPKHGDADSYYVYSIYTVSEIKKKNGGWMGHGSKSGGKCSEFGYNMIGLVKVSSSCVFKSGKRESVVYSVNLGQVDEKKTTPAFLPDREIAAIMVPDSGKVVVVRPAGVHGLPEKGAPSSLAERWKSGGSCDCGGWDVGCKLQVLAQEEKDSTNLALFVQEGKHERKLVFSLANLRNGLYSVQFDKSVPLLEAFSICVAILMSQKKVCSMFEVKEPSVSSDGVRQTDTTKVVPGGQGSARYVPSPPPSPVARI
ncbi:unnamed protein product [Cuscuta epithymum]|uniref:Uncharacterized protein n=1 Tax=Cuscuta epithymum TaxID=186058 RepID=A0AAV0F4W5_9ASTE|nr:unnamed protein product [Cuscuta epithymum]